MPGRLSAGPPRLAAWLLRGQLPPELAEAISGDLEEEFRDRVASSRRRLKADLWFWGQALTVRGFALRRMSRRLESMRPTWEHRRAGRARPFLHRWSMMPMRPEDVKYAVRRLIRAPGFTAVAVLSLALGIGANTAMFSLVNAVLLRDLPVRAPKQLVEIYTSESDGYPYATSSYPDYRDLRENVDVFAGVVGTRTFISRMDRGGEPKVVFGELISWDYFDVLGVPMALGRPFLEEEDQTPGSHAVVILGHTTWEQEFAADPSVLGRTIRLDGSPYTVVGVAPEAFTGSMPVMVTSMFVPLMMTNELMGGVTGSDQLGRRQSRSMFLKGRLKPGVTPAQADGAVKAFAAGLAERYPDTNELRTMTVLASGDVALHPLVDRALVPVAGLLLTVVGIVLLIACANLASFLLARAEDRRKEIAVRLALGAGRAALVRQLLVETTLLAGLGGIAGFLLAKWTLGLLMSFQPPLPIPVSFDVSLDRTVLWFTAGVSLAAGIAFGLAPALQATNPDVAPTLKDEGTGGGRPRRLTLRNGLVVVQVAFSLVLLIGAGLFVRSLQKAQHIDPGFDTGPAAVLWPMPEMSGYETNQERDAFYRTLEERLLAHPDVDAVAQADLIPLGAGIQTRGYVIPGHPSDSPDGDHDIDNATVRPGYFDAMGIPLLRGRDFQEADVDGDEVAVVSQAFADRFFPGEEVIGRVIENSVGDPIRIVGLVGDVKVRTLGEEARPYVYGLNGQLAVPGLQIVVRGRGTGPHLLEVARGVLREVDPDVVVMDAKTMNDHLAIMLFPPRMAALLLSVFGGLALTLASIGIYGVVSYAVSKRTRELGIRMSLGASASDVVRMAVGGGMRLVVIGSVVGILLAVGVTWSIAGFLYGIGTTDVVTFAAIPAILSGVALLAAYVPARRASAVDPVRALRSQ
jgi:predicted permease